MEIKIVTLPPDKWHEYKRIRLQALKQVPAAFGSTYEREATYTDDQWKEKLEKYERGKTDIMFFAVDGEKTVGLLGGYWGTEELGENKVRLVAMYVDENYQRKGIGKKLMSAVLEKLSTYPELHTVELEVYQQQTGAISLYKSMGFAVARTNKFMKNGVEYDDYIMEKKLD